MKDESDFVLFLDETGNHGMAKIDDNYPVFGLCGSLFYLPDYRDQAIPCSNNLKLRFFRHEGIHFHSTAIRRAEGPFQFLTVESLRNEFLADISQLMIDLRLTLFFVGMNKKNHAAKYLSPAHPYHYSLELLLERLHYFCQEKSIVRLPIVAESRGKAEDSTLLTEFHRILEHGTSFVTAKNFNQCGLSLEFAKKEQNVTGLQITDLLAYPIGRWIHTGKMNQPTEIALAKIHTYHGRKIGLKIIS